MNDREALVFWRWVAHRDADAFAELLSRYSGMVYTACCRITGDAGAAEDLSQECFLKLSQQTRPIKAPGAWLHRVATCASISWLRTQRRRGQREERYAAEQRTAHEDDHPDWAALMPRVDAAIDELPEKERAAIVLRFMQGKTHAEIGHELGISRQAVQKRIEKGLQMLRLSLGEIAKGLTAGVLLSLFTMHLRAQAAPAPLVAALGKQALTVSQFVPRPHLTWLLKGAMIMSTKKALVAVVCLSMLLLGGGVFYYQGGTAAFGGGASDSMASAQAGDGSSTKGLASTSGGTSSTDASSGPKASMTGADSGSGNSEPPTGTEQPKTGEGAEGEGEEGGEGEASNGEPVKVSGTVYSGDMIVMPGARVWLEVGDNEALFETMSDEDGRYSIEVNTFGRAAIHCQAKGYVMKDHFFKLKPGEGCPETNFMMTIATSYVRGIVVTANDAPVAEAEVTLATVVITDPSNPQDGMTQGGPRVVTASDGTFEVGLSVRGICEFHVKKDGIGEGVYPNIKTDTEDARFVLAGSGSIAGTVTLADGSPAAGYAVAIAASRSYEPDVIGDIYKSVLDEGQSCSTDSTGHYQLDNLSPQSLYQIAVTSQQAKCFPQFTSDGGYAMQSLATKLDVHVEAGQLLTGVDFQLQANPYTRIYGRVLDRTSGNPLKGVDITCDLTSPSVSLAMCHPAADGTYDLKFTLDKTRDVTINAITSIGTPGPVEIEGQQGATVSLAPGDEKELNVRTDAPGTIPVKVVDGSGAPLPKMGVGLGVAPPDGNQNLESGIFLADGLQQTDESGRCTIDSVPSGFTYCVIVHEQGIKLRNGEDAALLAQSEQFTLSPGETVPEVVLVVDEKGGIAGIAQLEDGSPLANTPLIISARGIQFTTMTAKDGAFSADKVLLPGVYNEITFTATIQGNHWTAALPNITINPKQIVDAGPVVLTQQQN